MDVGTSPTKRQCKSKSSTPSRLVVGAGKENNHKAASTITKKNSDGTANTVSCDQNATAATSIIVPLAELERHVWHC